MSSPSLPPPELVATPEGLARLVDTLKSCDAVAVDTESNSLHAYRERVCLIQFSTATADYIVDPVALPDLSPLGLETFECGTGEAIGGSFQQPQDGYVAQCWTGAPAGDTFIDVANAVQDEVRLATEGVDATAVYCPEDALGDVGGIACRVTEVDGEVLVRTVVILSDIGAVLDDLPEEPTDQDVQAALEGAEVEVLVGTEPVPAG